MTDLFPISSDEGKIPNIPLKKSFYTTLKAVNSMEPSTAYIAVKTVLLPILSKLSLQEDIFLSSPSTKHLAKAESHTISYSSIREAGNSLKELESKLRQIEQKLKNLEASKQAILDRWKDSFKNSPISFDNEVFKNFYYLRENILKYLEDIKNAIQKLKKNLPQTSSVKKILKDLEGIHKSLLSKIPNPSSNWNKSSGHWKPPGSTKEAGSLRFWWEKEKGKEAIVSLWKDSDRSLPENPIGFLEMVVNPDQTKYQEYMKLLTKALEKTKDLLAPLKKGILFEPLSTLSTEKAYMYLITTLLPELQNQASDSIEQMGELMKQISRVFDKYTDIQNEINFIKKIAKKFMDERGQYFTGQDWKDFERFRDLRTNINIKLGEIEGLLKDVERKIPPTAQTLISTLREINDKLLIMPSISDKWDPKTNKYDGKGWVGKDNGGSEFTIEWNDKNNPLGLIESILDPDQTRFKVYIDNLGQATTSMTSISNMTQQEVQIASQYYNSLLGFQKSAFDSLNKVIQNALRPPNN